MILELHLLRIWNLMTGWNTYILHMLLLTFPERTLSSAVLFFPLEEASLVLGSLMTELDVYIYAQ